MGKIEIDHTGANAGITLSSDGTSLLLDGTAIGGGGSALTIEDKTTAYTVIADDLGKVINCTTGTFTVTLTAAATLGAGFNVTIWNIGTGVITIDPDGTERINELLTLTLQKGEGVSIICTGTEFQTGISKLRLYSDNTDVNANSPIAAGDRSVAIGAGATTANFATMAIGYLSLANQNGAVALGYTSNATGAYSLAISGNAGRQYTTAIGVNSGGNKAVTATGDGAMALGGSYASGSNSFAAAITNNTSSYGATGANSISVGRLAKASNTGGNAIGWGATSTHEYSSAFGVNATTTTDHQVALGGSGYPVLVSGAYKLPTADGTANQVLQTNGSGVLSFATAGGGGTALELYAENPSSPTAPSATGTNAVAIGSESVSAGLRSISLGDSYASGTDSFAAAITNNTSSYGATGANSVAMGNLAKATSYYSISIGWNNSAGNRSLAIGGQGSTAGDNSVCVGTWQSNISNAYSAAVGGGKASDRGVQNRWAYGLVSAPAVGAAQGGLHVEYAQTTDATPTVLKTNSSPVNTQNQVILPNNSAYAFHGTIVARQQASQGTACAAWKIEGLIRREGSAGTTVLVNSATTVLDNTPAWGMALSADTTNGGLKIEVTGAAATNIRWVASINTSEVTY